MGTSAPRRSGEQVRTALLLAAGTGSRLAPLTDSTAKCLVGVSLIPILERLVRSLNAYGFSRLVVVVGHEAAAIQDYLGDHSHNIEISYVVNPRYKTTNNIYSLWLARKVIDEPFLLVESDLVFDESLLEEMLQPDRIAISERLPWMNGTTVTLDGDSGVGAFCLDALSSADADHFKTVNIYSLSRATWREACERLDQHIAAGQTSDYYECVFAEMVADGSLALEPVFFPADRWYEIDTLADLEAAERVFPRSSVATAGAKPARVRRWGGRADQDATGQVRAARELDYEALTSTHGGYWRHGFVDHAYLYNLYFPPESLFEQLGSQIHELVLNYPVAQDVLAGLVGDLIGQPAERIAVGNGAAELIKVISGHLAGKLIVPVPSFNEYANAAPEGRIIEFALEPPSFELDVDRFAAEAIAGKADFAVVVTPNNPTSLLAPKADLFRLLNALDGHGCMLIVDESFIDFAQEGSEGSLEDVVAQYQNLAILKSMSKEYGICGLRIGYLLTADEAFVQRVRGGLPIWNLNGFAEAFLRLAPLYRHEFASSCAQVRADRDEFYRDLSRIPGLLVYRPEANFIFCRLPDDAPSGPEVTRALFVEENIYIKHCQDKTMPESSRYIRIASRTRRENRALTDALQRVLGPEEAR
jgi:threonine-phosphate decarboxylase